MMDITWDIYRRTFLSILSVVTTHDVLFTGTIESNFALKRETTEARICSKALHLANCGFILQHLWG